MVIKKQPVKKSAIKETAIKKTTKPTAKSPTTPRMSTVESSKGNKFKVPKSLASAADRMYVVRMERYKQQKIVDKLQEEETVLSTYLIDNLPKSDATGAAGRIARATINSKSRPRVVDWDLVYKYASRNKAFDLFQKRLSDEAVMSRWDAGKKIPGIESFKVVTVSLNKL